MRSRMLSPSPGSTLGEAWRARESFAQEVTFELVSEELQFFPGGGDCSRVRNRGVQVQKGVQLAMGCSGSSQRSGEYWGRGVNPHSARVLPRQRVPPP